MINAEIAAEQVGLTLDLGQQLAQDAPILPAPAHAVTLAAASPSPDAADGVLDDQRRRIKVRAERESLALELERAEAAAKSGAWMVTAEAEAQWSGELASLRRAIESWLATDAAESCLTLANRGDADRRDFALALRQGWDALCARLSSEAAAIQDDTAP